MFHNKNPKSFVFNFWGSLHIGAAFFVFIWVIGLWVTGDEIECVSEKSVNFAAIGDIAIKLRVIYVKNVIYVCYVSHVKTQS